MDAIPQESRQAMRERSRLPAPRPRDHEHRSAGGEHDGALLIVEVDGEIGPCDLAMRLERERARQVGGTSVSAGGREGSGGRDHRSRAQGGAPAGRDETHAHPARKRRPGAPVESGTADGGCHQQRQKTSKPESHVAFLRRGLNTATARPSLESRAATGAVNLGAPRTGANLSGPQASVSSNSDTREFSVSAAFASSPAEDLSCSAPVAVPTAAWVTEAMLRAT